MTPLRTSNPFRFRTILNYTLFALAVAAFIGYAIFQARFLIEGPLVEFETSPAIASSERVVHLVGTARNITSLSLNGREIFTDQTGYFNEPVVLENGYTIATITARDRYGRERRYEHSIVYTPAYQ